jgi:hypothetical protein
MFKIFIYILIIGLFLYSKLLPHKDKLDLKYKKIFDFFNAIFTPIFKFFTPIFKPMQLGIGLSVDLTQIVLLIILLILLNLF